MAGLVPAIHVLHRPKDVDARHKAGHDELARSRASVFTYPRTVARTHQPGCAVSRLRAAAPAAADVSNKPKQVAPEPDMRASRQFGGARNAASTSAMTGCSATAAGSRSFT